MASLVSFPLIVALLAVLCLRISRPLPTTEGLGAMPWWAPLGGLVGAGAFAGLTITAKILMSLAIDHFGGFGVEPHSMNVGRIVGAVLMVAGICAISWF